MAFEGTPAPATVAQIALCDIAPSTLNPRKRFDRESLWDLANDIRLNGVLQPITVRPARLADFGEIAEAQFEGRPYILVLGERRWRASNLLEEMLTIPCIIREKLTDQEHLAMAYSENTQRADLTAMECAAAYQKMLNLEMGLTQEALGKRLGVSQSRISNRLRLLRLPEAFHRHIDADLISESVALVLLGLEDWPDILRSAGGMALTEHWTQAVAEAQVRELRAAAEREDARVRAEAQPSLLPAEEAAGTDGEPAAAPAPAPVPVIRASDYSAPNVAAPTATGPDAITAPIQRNEFRDEPPAARELGSGVTNLPPGQKSAWFQWCSNAGHDNDDKGGLAWAAYLTGWTGGEYAKGKRRVGGEWQELSDLAERVPQVNEFTEDEEATAGLEEETADEADVRYRDGLARAEGSPTATAPGIMDSESYDWLWEVGGYPDLDAAIQDWRRHYPYRLTPLSRLLIDAIVEKWNEEDPNDPITAVAKIESMLLARAENNGINVAAIKESLGIEDEGDGEGGE